jgi:hypothetical protein
MEWNQIDVPGCYLVIETGELARVFPEAVDLGASPQIRVTLTGSTRVVRLVGNPSADLARARSIALDHGYFFSF